MAKVINTAVKQAARIYVQRQISWLFKVFSNKNTKYFINKSIFDYFILITFYAKYCEELTCIKKLGHFYFKK